MTIEEAIQLTIWKKKSRNTKLITHTYLQGKWIV